MAVHQLGSFRERLGSGALMRRARHRLVRLSARIALVERVAGARQAHQHAERVYADSLSLSGEAAWIGLSLRAIPYGLGFGLLYLLMTVWLGR